MHYVYKKSKSATLPKFSYVFQKFSDFYELAATLTMSLVDYYYIQIKTDIFEEVNQFLKVADQYQNMVIYIEVSETLMDYLTLRRPQLSVLDSKNNFEIFEELVSKYEVLFEPKVMSSLYWAIGHSYSEMSEAMELLRETYGTKHPVSEDDLSKLFVIDRLVYPRRVLIMYLCMYRGRQSNLKKCIDHFGNNMVLYSMRKSARGFFKEKLKYLKTGKGNKLIQLLPINNLIWAMRILDYERRGFMDIYTLMDLYEKGVTVNDIISERTGIGTNA